MVSGPPNEGVPPSRPIPDPGFAGDAGQAPPELVAALAAYASDPARGSHPALSVLQHSRLLVPVVAMLGEDGPEPDRGGSHQPPREKSADMATVLMRGRDGRMALLAFTGLESMRRWQADARPVPVAAADAARAAVHDDAAAIVVDVAGPVMFVVEEDDLRSLAEGHTLTELGDGYAWVTPG